MNTLLAASNLRGYLSRAARGAGLNTLKTPLISAICKSRAARGAGLNTLAVRRRRCSAPSRAARGAGLNTLERIKARRDA